MLGVILISMTTLAVTSAGPSCDAGWSLFGNSCFRLYSARKTWRQAREFCLGQEAHLATIRDVKTKDFITRHFLPGHRNNIWIGLNALIKSNQYEWVDTGLKLTHFKDWSPGEPKGSGCGYLWGDKNHRWDEGYCYSNFQFLCEKSASRTCNKIFTDDSGLIMSPNYPMPYLDNHSCKWTIQVPEGDVIKLVFYRPFELERNCNYDYVKVTDVSPSGQRTPMGTWCGTNVPPTIVSTSSRLDLYFKTDVSRAHVGFAVSWQKVESCGGKFMSTSGSLQTPGYPSKYPNNKVCRWEISPPAGTSIRLRFGQVFKIEGGVDCAWDYLEVLKGSKSIGKWCGNTAPKPVTSEGEKLTVVFKSDSNDGSGGFSAFWDVSVAPRIARNDY